MEQLRNKQCHHYPPPQRGTASGASNDDASARVPTKVDEW